MRVLGVDPGSIVTGWGLLGGSPGAPTLDDCGWIRLADGPLAGRLAHLLSELDTLVARVEPEVAAVEAPFHGKSSLSALRLAHARGVVLASLAARGVEVCEYPPATVKQAITGNGRADKSQVRRMVSALLGSRADTYPADVTDALAVAWTHVARCRYDRAVAHALGAGPAARRAGRLPREDPAR